MADKVIRDGMVAVLYSPGFGAGWSTWGGDEIALFHPRFVEWVEGGKVGDIDAIAAEVMGDDSFYTGGAEDLQIRWLPVGTRFEINEYDGSESVREFGPADGFIA